MEEDDIKLEELKKADLSEVSTIFKDEILLNENRIDELKEHLEKNNFIKKESLRPIAWKIFLGLIPEENNKVLEEWIDIIDSKRNEYKNKLEKYCSFSLKKDKSEDPLLINENKDSDDIMKNDNDQNIRNLINLDLIRTHQNIDLFKNNKTKNILFNVLYIYAKESTDLPYGQGMNELVSFLYICLYPYYFTKTDKQKKSKDEIKEYLNDIDNHYEDIYLYFHDEEEIQSDLYFLFESLMYKGVKDLYAKDEVKKDDKNYHLYELFPDIIKDISNEDKPIPLNLRAFLLIKEKLKLLDKRLYNHFKQINISCNYFLHRWYKCIFIREFEIKDALCLWDKILLYEHQKRRIYQYPLLYMDYICLAMIIRIRSRLIKKEEGDCFTILFHYPKVDDISEVIDIAEKIREIFENKLNGEQYNVDEIFELIKDNVNVNDDENNSGDGRDELIIAPHNYNQFNSNALISFDKKNEYIVFCGNYYLKKKYLFLFCFILIIFILLILFYYNILKA